MATTPVKSPNSKSAHNESSSLLVNRTLFEQSTPEKEFSPNMESIKVHLRIRPLTPGETIGREPIGLRQVGHNCIEVSQAMTQAANAGKYYFDHVFSDTASQDEVYNHTTKGLVLSMFYGINSLIFAYGVTNSGKTYTVHGSEKDNGILSRALHTLFTSIDLAQRSLGLESTQQAIADQFGSHETFDCFARDLDPNSKYSVVISALEIYNEKLTDLLGDGRRELRLAEEDGDLFVKGLHEVEVRSVSDAVSRFKQAKSRVQMGQTVLNFDSSRSHTAFILKLCRTTDQSFGVAEVMSRLTICDLAGSERTARTMNTGVRLKESTSINQSLVVLGRCMESLRWNQSHGLLQKRVVPYRESKVARLFQGTLSGNGKCVMIVNVSPCARDLDETIHALKYSYVAKEVATPATPGSKKKMLLSSDTPTAKGPSPLKRKGDSSYDLSSVNDINKALSEIQSLSRALEESKVYSQRIEFDVRGELSANWRQSLWTLQLTMNDQMEARSMAEKTMYEKKMAIQAKLFELKMAALVQQHQASLASGNSSSSSSSSVAYLPPLPPAEPDNSKELCELRKQVEGLTHSLRREKNRTETLEKEISEKSQNEKRVAADQKTLEESVTSLEFTNKLLRCEVETLKAERVRCEIEAHENDRKLKQATANATETSTSMSESLAAKDKELNAKDREIKTLKQKLENAEKALAAEESIHMNQRKTIDSLTTANAHAANTIKSQHQIAEQQKMELDVYVRMEQKWKQDLDAANQANSALRATINELKAAAVATANASALNTSSHDKSRGRQNVGINTDVVASSMTTPAVSVSYITRSCPHCSQQPDLQATKTKTPTSSQCASVASSSSRKASPQRHYELPTASSCTSRAPSPVPQAFRSLTPDKFDKSKERTQSPIQRAPAPTATMTDFNPVMLGASASSASLIATATTASSSSMGPNSINNSNTVVSVSASSLNRTSPVPPPTATQFLAVPSSADHNPHMRGVSPPPPSSRPVTPTPTNAPTPTKSTFDMTAGGYSASTASSASKRKPTATGASPMRGLSPSAHHSTTTTANSQHPASGSALGASFLQRARAYFSPNKEIATRRDPSPVPGTSSASLAKHHLVPPKGLPDAYVTSPTAGRRLVTPTAIHHHQHPTHGLPLGAAMAATGPQPQARRAKKRGSDHFDEDMEQITSRVAKVGCRTSDAGPSVHVGPFPTASSSTPRAVGAAAFSPIAKRTRKIAKRSEEIL